MNTKKCVFYCIFQKRFKGQMRIWILNASLLFDHRVGYFLLCVYNRKSQIVNICVYNLPGPRSKSVLAALNTYALSVYYCSASVFVKMRWILDEGYMTLNQTSTFFLPTQGMQSPQPPPPSLRFLQNQNYFRKNKPIVLHEDAAIQQSPTQVQTKSKQAKLWTGYIFMWSKVAYYSVTNTKDFYFV